MRELADAHLSFEGSTATHSDALGGREDLLRFTAGANSERERGLLFRGQQLLRGEVGVEGEFRGNPGVRGGSPCFSWLACASIAPLYSAHKRGEGLHKKGGNVDRTPETTGLFPSGSRSLPETPPVPMSHGMSAQPVAFFDLDNTFVKGSAMFFLVKGMYRRGYFSKSDIARFVIANLRYRLTGTENPEEIEKYKHAAMEFIEGHTVQEMTQLADEIYEEFISPKLWQGTIALAHDHLAKGHEVWLITASPSEMANLVASRLGLTGALGTRAEAIDGVYTGRLLGELLHEEAKAEALRSMAAERELDLSNCYAYSDSHHDLPLLRSVGNPNAINPDATLGLIAYANEWGVHDFRRWSTVTRKFGPLIARLAGLLMLLKPRSRRNSAQ